MKNELGINYKVHQDGRIILDYCQISSPKRDPIVRECRGLVLDTEFNLVAKSFTRFFNAGEVREDDKKFNWDCDVLCSHKEDGSLILLYNYNGKWCVNTRFSFAEHNVNDCPFTWSELVKMGFDYDNAGLDPSFTYVLELCSRYNKVVRDYSVPQVYLLTMFSGEMEMNFDVTVEEAKQLGLKTPHVFKAGDIFDVQQYITQIAETDKTFEGIVTRDVFNNRLKFKSDFYLQLHRLNNNGNLASVKNLIPVIMSGETDEVLVYYPELKDKLEEISCKINSILTEIDNVWYCHHDEKSQKHFAQKIIKDTKHTAPLFSARKLGGHPKDYVTVEYLLNHVS